MTGRFISNCLPETFWGLARINHWEKSLSIYIYIIILKSKKVLHFIKWLILVNKFIYKFIGEYPPVVKAIEHDTSKSNTPENSIIQNKSSTWKLAKLKIFIRYMTFLSNAKIIKLTQINSQQTGRICFITINFSGKYNSIKTKKSFLLS